MIWNTIRRLSLFHRRGYFEALLMLTAGAWILFNVQFTEADQYTNALRLLMVIGAMVSASLLYWAIGVLWFGLRVLWALGKLIVHAIRVKLGKVGAI